MVISFATKVANTVPKYVSFTNKYSNADLCQNIYRQVVAAITETWKKLILIINHIFERQIKSTLNLSSEDPLLSNSGESKNSHGPMGCKS